MKIHPFRAIVRRAAAVASSVAVAGVLSGFPASAPAAVAAGEAYIVVLAQDARNDAAAAEMAAAVGDDHGLTVTASYGTALTAFAAEVPAGALGDLRRDPRVAAVEPDLPVEAAGGLPIGVDRIGADAAAEGEAPRRAGEPVAVLDTGIAPHPDLNVVGGHDCTSGDPGRWGDDNGHGTHVAGIIGGAVTGVAPGTPLHAVKVLDARGRGSWSSLICGLNWVAQRGVPVANLSLAGPAPNDDDTRNCTSSALHQAICNAMAGGTKVVVAAGNSGRDARSFAPALYNQVVAVSALADSDGCPGGRGAETAAGPDDTLAGYSNWGQVVDVAAPGVGIRSTWLDGGYRKQSGTSMAAPHVAAAYALGWDGAVERGALAGDRDGADEGVVRLSDHTACRLTITKPTPGDGRATTSGRPKISALVLAHGRPVTEGDIRLFVDLVEIDHDRFGYTENGVVFHVPDGLEPLGLGGHMVTVVVSDGDATVSRSWDFTVKRKKRR